MKTIFYLATGLLVVLGACNQAPAEDQAGNQQVMVEFTEAGDLQRPDPTEWIFVSSSATDTASEMAAGAEAKSEGKFNIIHIDPAAWAAFKETGTFPEGTVVTMSFYDMDPKDMGRPRLWASELTGMEVGVKDAERFEEGWGYFRFTGAETTATAFPRERCFDCHIGLAETDNVFTQLYTVFQKSE